jgi:predicted DNA-binding transcriptional regulator YafY
MQMQRTKAQYVRLMELDRQIRAGKYPNCLTFAQEWEVSQKTVQRDIDFLRDQCGAPIEYDKARKGFSYEDPTWMLPAVMLTEGDLLALLLGAHAMEQYAGTPVAAELRRVFAKLTGSLPDGISIRPESLFTDFTFRGPPAKPIDPDVWATVVRGLLDRRTVRVQYRPFDVKKPAAGKWSRINPYHLANLHGEWYVFAVHADYDDVRQFALPRIKRAELTDESFAVPDDFDAEALLSPVFGRYAGDGKVHTVRLLFDKDIADWITERQWHPEQKLKRRGNGEIELTFPAKGLYEVQRWVLSWGASVQVLGPEHLKSMIQEEVRRMRNDAKH